MTTKRKPKKKPMPIARAAFLAGYRAGHTDALKAVPQQVFVEALASEPEATIKPSWLARLWKRGRG